MPRRQAIREPRINLKDVAPERILRALAKLPIRTWNYKRDDPRIRHIGPMAQDFARVFKVGDSDRHIHLIDALGVAYASIRALDAMAKKRAARVASLERELGRLRSELRALRRVKTKGRL